MKNVTKQEMVIYISRKTGLTMVDTKIVIEETLETIKNMLARGETIEIRGFGTFSTRLRKERPGRNPKTGEPALVPSRMMPKFKYSKEIKRDLRMAFLGITKQDIAETNPEPT